MVQENGRIYWGWDNQLKTQKAKIKAWEGPETNKALILQFLDNLAARGTKEARQAKLAWELRVICNWLEKPLSEATKRDLERVAGQISNSKYTENTKSDYRRALKHFYRWFEEEDGRLTSKDENERLEARKAYKFLTTIKTTAPLKDLDPGSMIKEEDIRRVIEKGCRYDHEKAFVRLTHETGCRVGEVLGIRLKDIDRKETLWSVRVSGKTGERTVFLRESIPYLVRWLEIHPDNQNPNAYLWVSLHNRFYGKPLRYDGARRLLKRTFVRAGVDKKSNSHHFRHSRSSIDGQRYTEAICCSLRGWRIGSQMARRYTHIGNKEAERAVMRAYDLEPAEKKTEEAKPQYCICGRINTPESYYCDKCGKALRIDTAMKEQEYLSLAFKLLTDIMQDTEKRAAFEAWKAQKAK